MDNNELMKELYDTLKKSGWYDKATSYFKEHPELFGEGMLSGNKIASISMSVSYQPESLSAMRGMIPSVFISMGHFDTTAYEFIVLDTGITKSRTWNDNKIIKEEITNHV
ncbi:MAG: hypothetical protein UIM53_07255 [Acutalibacteraceae bacterium]|nr:hypothetical protein [Acutalibacteraceae bacterium]